MFVTLFSFLNVLIGKLLKVKGNYRKEGKVRTRVDIFQHLCRCDPQNDCLSLSKTDIEPVWQGHPFTSAKRKKSRLPHYYILKETQQARKEDMDKAHQSFNQTH